MKRNPSSTNASATAYCNDCGVWVDFRDETTRRKKRGRCPKCWDLFQAKERERNRRRVRPKAERRTLDTGRWKQARAKALRRDGNACVACGRTDGLSVHHIIPRDERPELAFTLSNLTTLCRATTNERNGGRPVFLSASSTRVPESRETGSKRMKWL